MIASFGSKPVLVAALVVGGLSSGLALGWVLKPAPRAAMAAVPTSPAAAATPSTPTAGATTALATGAGAAAVAVAATTPSRPPANAPVRVDQSVTASADPIGALAAQATGQPRPAAQPTPAAATPQPATRPGPRDTDVSWTSAPTRVERREPTVAAATPAPAPATPQPPGTQFQRVEVVDAGAFRSGDRTVRIAGIVPPQPEQRCTDQAGNAWPCGRRARSALEAYLRNKQLVCHDGAANGRMRCEANGSDVATWLVTQGWAMAADGAPPALRQAEGDARRRGAGQFVPDHRAAEQAPAAPPAGQRATAPRG